MTDAAGSAGSAGGELWGLDVSVIVPARNERETLPGCLESLVRQSEPGFALGAEWELIVVDDHSADGTGEIARGFAGEGVEVLDAPELDTRGGFTGKNSACWAAAQRARGRLLLFTDADTVHEPGSVMRARAEMEEHGVAMLSYSPRQRLTGFWQHAVMPLIFSELASIYPPREVNDPVKAIAAANGQFLMVESVAYFAVGGHRAVGDAVLEDVALARRVKESGRGIRLRYGGDALSARMYGTFGEMVEGWSKNLALLCPSPVALALWRMLDVALFFGLPLLALGLWWLADWQRWALGAVWLRTAWRFYSRVARSNFPAMDVAVSIAGVPVFVYLLLRSVFLHRVKKNVVWKGRSYNTMR